MYAHVDGYLLIKHFLCLALLFVALDAPSIIWLDRLYFVLAAHFYILDSIFSFLILSWFFCFGRALYPSLRSGIRSGFSFLRLALPTSGCGVTTAILHAGSCCLYAFAKA